MILMLLTLVSLIIFNRLKGADFETRLICWTFYRSVCKTLKGNSLMSVIFHLSITKTIMPNVMLFLRASSSLSCPLCLHPYSDNMCLNGKGKLLHLTTQWSGEAEPRERNSFHLSRAWTVRALERSNFPFGLSSRAPVTKRYPPPLPLPPPLRTRIKSVICVVSVLPHLEFLVYL